MARTEKRKIGDFGERIAEMFLVKRGYKVIEKNYLKKWGEIDLIAEKGDKLHFVEVKSANYISEQKDNFRPEDKIHPAKIARLLRTIEIFLLEKGREGDDWQIDALVVFFDTDKKRAKVNLIENINL